VLAIDIGSHSVKLVAGRHAASGARVDAVGLAELPPDALHGHVVRRPEPVAQAIRTLLRALRGRRGPVVTAVPGPAVMIRRLLVQAPGPAGLDDAVVRAMDALVPGALDQVVLDYQTLAPVATDGAVPVLAVAARRDLVQGYSAAIRAAGLAPCLVDVDVFALDRLHRASRQPRCEEAPVALVHVGARYAAVTVVRGDAPVVAADDVPAGAGVEPASLARAIARALDVGWPEDRARLAGVVVSGGAARAPGLGEALTGELGCVVRVVDPFASVTLGAGVDRATLAARAPAFAVAVGLALRPPGGNA
jgi:type IV pilus assembly protein PilM